MKFEDQWFSEGLWRQYKVKKIHFTFQDIAKRNEGGVTMQSEENSFQVSRILRKYLSV